MEIVVAVMENDIGVPLAVITVEVATTEDRLMSLLNPPQNCVNSAIFRDMKHSHVVGGSIFLFVMRRVHSLHRLSMPKQQHFLLILIPIGIRIPELPII